MITVRAFYDSMTSTLTYVVHWPGHGKEAIVIDPVWDFDPADGKLAETALAPVLDYLESHSLEPIYCLETHAHADHLSGSQLLKRHYPTMKVAISQRITTVQSTFSKLFHLDGEVATDGSQFDRLLEDWEEFKVGPMVVKVIPTPGHTPACSSYLIGDCLFTGDALFMPDQGTGRCDFPDGSAARLYDSLTRHLYTLPPQTRVFVGHDYQPDGRALAFETTIAAEVRDNVQLPGTITREEFIANRERRDRALAAPRLLLPSIQVNIRAGRLPDPESNGVAYLKLPLRPS